MGRSRAGSGEAADRGSRAPRGRSAHRRAAGLLALAGASCTDLLDIPEHPRLTDAPESPLTERSASGDSEGDAPPNPGAVSNATAGDGMREALTRPALMAPLTQSSGSETPAPLEALDAGVPASDASPATDAAPARLPCPAPQSLGPNGDCFSTVTTLLTWADARQTCRDLGTGWDLASIRSGAINDFVSRLLEGEAWIGAEDRTSEGSWRWVSDGSLFWRGRADAGSAVNDAYINWSSSEPNDNRNSDCARIVPEQNGAWADLECLELRAAVCEGPAR